MLNKQSLAKKNHESILQKSNKGKCLNDEDFP